MTLLCETSFPLTMKFGMNGGRHCREGKVAAEELVDPGRVFEGMANEIAVIDVEELEI